MNDVTSEWRGWPERSWLLAALGVLCGLGVHVLTRGLGVENVSALRLAGAACLTVTGLGFAYTLERGRQTSSVAFAVLAGLVVAFVVYWNGPPGSSNGEEWRFVCAALTVAIAAPLFLSWRDGPGGRVISYIGAHNRAWTAVVLWFASWAFVGIVWLLLWLLSALFNLIKIDLLSDLMRQDWFGMVLTGGALGGAIGLLRDREAILGTLQRVVTTVLSVLAPVLAAGLLLFLIALPFTGLEPLWQATKSTTPILIGSVIGALILVNAVIGDAPEDEAKLPVLRWSAMGLGVAMLPLGIIAAISTGLRIQQYGLTPDRLWAVVFTGIACAYGLVYLTSLVRKRLDWAALVRGGNLRMAVALCVIAFVLAMPFISFGAISTRDQLARLADGRTPVSKFDWSALRFDFGPSGRAAVERLAKSGKTADIRTAAATALQSGNRWEAKTVTDAVSLDTRLTILPKKVPLPPALRNAINNEYGCSGESRCALMYEEGADRAILVTEGNVTRFKRETNNWEREYGTELDNDPKAVANGLAKGDVVIREIKRRQVFVGGQPVGQPFE
jgi:Domain of unknown function (DUF4153)